MFAVRYPHQMAASVAGKRPWIARRLSKALFLVPACLSMAMGLPSAVKAELKRSTFVYKTVGDVEIHADVYRPDDSGNRPVIAWFHGGALMMGSRQGVPRQLQDLSQREGYVLVSFDYRLAPEAKIPEIIDDVRDALTWIRRSGPGLFGADPIRLVAYWGFGDVVGKWTTEPNQHYREKMPLVSEEDAWAAVGEKVITGTDKTNGRARGNLFIYLKQNGLWAKVASGFDPDTEPDKLTPLCPIRNLSPQYPPILMLHGTADKDVPYDQSVEMARALERLGRPHELITVEKGGHSLWGGDPKLIEQAFARSIEFIHEKLSTP